MRPCRPRSRRPTLAVLDRDNRWWWRRKLPAVREPVWHARSGYRQAPHQQLRPASAAPLAWALRCMCCSLTRQRGAANFATCSLELSCAPPVRPGAWPQCPAGRACTNECACAGSTKHVAVGQMPGGDSQPGGLCTTWRSGFTELGRSPHSDTPVLHFPDSAMPPFDLLPPPKRYESATITLDCSDFSATFAEH